MKESLESLIRRIVEDVRNGKADGRILSYVDYKTKYAILKSKVSVEVELTEGKVVKFDVSDYFKELLEGE